MCYDLMSFEYLDQKLFYIGNPKEFYLITLFTALNAIGEISGLQRVSVSCKEHANVDKQQSIGVVKVSN